MRVETVADASAPIESVWETVTDLSAYPIWNPFIRRVDVQRDVDVGVSMVLVLDWGRFRGPRRSPERVVRVDPPSPVRDYGVFVYTFHSWLTRAGLLRAVRTQEMWRLSPGRTRYRTVEFFRGPATPLVPRLAVQDGFERQTRALVTRAEARSGDHGESTR